MENEMNHQTQDQSPHPIENQHHSANLADNQLENSEIGLYSASRHQIPPTTTPLWIQPNPPVRRVEQKTDEEMKEDEVRRDQRHDKRANQVAPKKKIYMR